MLMMINGHQLPSSFAAIVKDKSLLRSVGCWELKVEIDTFGNKLETEIGEIWDTEEKLLKETKELQYGFEENEYYGGNSEYSTEPGFIEDVIEFSDIVAFAISGDGSPFCFDYRNNNENPEIIWWDDVYWRKVSNNYDEFIALFKINT